MIVRKISFDFLTTNLKIQNIIQWSKYYEIIYSNHLRINWTISVVINNKTYILKLE